MTRSVRTRGPRVSIAMVISPAVLGGCGLFDSSGTDRQAGQVTLFQVAPGVQTLNRTTPRMGDLAPERTRDDLTQNWGNFLKYSTDVVTVQIHSLHLEDLPRTMTGSRDIAVFVEVWQHASSAYNSQPLTSIAYLGKNQVVPGHMNFSGAVVYGPVAYGGAPLKIRFTVMVLQKERGQDQSDIAEVISKYTALIPTYGVFASQFVGVIRDMLRAQPDVIAFDYDAVLMSQDPSGTMGNDTPGDAGVMGKPASLSRAEAVARQWDAWDRRTAWLQYGYFALVETAPRHGTFQMSKDGRYSADRKYVLDGDALYDASSPLSAAPAPAVVGAAPKPAAGSPGAGTGMTGERPVAALPDSSGSWDADLPSWEPPAPLRAEGRLKANYMVFSVTPRQIELTDEFMRVASDANAALLSSLRQTPENVKLALDSVRAQAGRLELRMVEARLNDLGRTLATVKGQNPSTFESEFTQRAEEVRRKLDGGWSGPERGAEFDAVAHQIRTRYADLLRSIKTPVSPDSDLGRARSLVSDAASRIAALEHALSRHRSISARAEAAMGSLGFELPVRLTSIGARAQEAVDSTVLLSEAVDAWVAGARAPNRRALAEARLVEATKRVDELRKALAVVDAARPDSGAIDVVLDDVRRVSDTDRAALDSLSRQAQDAVSAAQQQAITAEQIARNEVERLPADAPGDRLKATTDTLTQSVQAVSDAKRLGVELSEAETAIALADRVALALEEAATAPRRLADARERLAELDVVLAAARETLNPSTP